MPDKWQNTELNVSYNGKIFQPYHFKMVSAVPDVEAICVLLEPLSIMLA